MITAKSPNSQPFIPHQWGTRAQGRRVEQSTEALRRNISWKAMPDSKIKPISGSLH